MSRSEPAPFVVDGWYSLLPSADHPRIAVAGFPLLRRLSADRRERLLSNGVARGVLIFLAGRHRAGVGMAREDPGWWTLLLLCALRGRPRLVGFQYIVHRRRRRIGRVLDVVDRWAVRRCLLRAHVLTRPEVTSISAHYRLPAERFVHVPWPRITHDAPAAPAQLPERPLVISAGRANCDWETLFAAAAGRGWPLVVVCGERDRRRVEALNEGVGRPATVHVELPRAQFGALLAQATVSIAAMKATEASQGHIRAADATAAGVPLVATRTTGFSGYVDDGATGLLVDPGDPAALAAAVDRLLGDRELSERLRRGARERAAGYATPHYFEALERFLRGVPTELPTDAPGA